MKLTLVTPGKRIVLGEEVSEITLPAFMGELNILPGHQPLITTLTPGVIRYKLKDGIEVAASISWGYCNISPEGVNVLAETVESANDIDFEATKEDLLIIERSMLTDTLDDDNWKHLQEKSAHTKAKLQMEKYLKN